MPISGEVLVDAGIVQTIVSGKVDDAAIINFEKNLGKLPGFKPDMSQLVDASGVIENLVTMEGLQKLVEVTPFNAGCRRAFVIADEKSAENAGMFATLASASQSELIYVTRNRDDAYNWLLNKPT